MAWAVLPRAARACFTRNDGGVAVEFAIISLAMVLVSLGVIEFGRAFSVRNELSFLADLAARQILNDATVSNQAVEDAIRAAFNSPNPEQLEIVLGTEVVDGSNYRTVSLQYPFTFLIPQLATGAVTLGVEERVPVT